MLSSLDKIGQFDRRIRIEQSTPTTDATTNEPIDAWTTLTTVWAKRMIPKTQEEYQSHQQITKRTASYELRDYLSTVTEQMRFYDKYDGFTYYILGIEQYDRKQGQVITVEIKL